MEVEHCVSYKGQLCNLALTVGRLRFYKFKDVNNRPCVVVCEDDEVIAEINPIMESAFNDELVDINVVDPDRII